MMISTKGRYALKVMVELATADPDKYISLKSIAEKEGISDKYLEAIIKQLVQGKMVMGLRGKGGGYRLAKDPSLCTVGEIIRLSEGSFSPVSCLDCQDDASCPRSDDCLTLPVWQGLDNVVNEYLNGITLEDIIKKNGK
jgi:Rrf2 family protein